MANSSAKDKVVASPSSQNFREFVLPQIWSVNEFVPKMTKDIFALLRPCFQIPDDVPIRKAEREEKCYLGNTEDVGFNKATFIAGLRLPLTEIHRRLVDYLGVFVFQISLNAWRIFLGAEVLWGQMSGGYRSLTLDKFFYCYKPQEIVASKGFYSFAGRKARLKLVSDMPDSNRYWKSRYYFFQGAN